jgi:hypothetical protein
VATREKRIAAKRAAAREERLATRARVKGEAAFQEA